MRVWDDEMNLLPRGIPFPAPSLTGRFVRQRCPARDRSCLVLMGWMVLGLLSSQAVCFSHWKTRLPLGHCLAAALSALAG